MNFSHFFQFLYGRSFGTVFHFVEISASFQLHRDESENSFHSCLVLSCIYSQPFLSALLSFFALKYAVLPSLLCTLCFLIRVPLFFLLQVLCSALNHDLPIHVFWGISVSNWYMWHLFNKLWKYFQEERNTSKRVLFERVITPLGASCPRSHRG